MFEEINSWLNSDREFLRGLALYDRYGTSFNQKRLLRMQGPSRKSNEILVYELSKLIKGMKPAAAPAPKNAPAIIVKKKPEPLPKTEEKKPQPHPPAEAKEKRPVSQDPQELKKHVIDLMKVRDNLHARLELIPTDKERNESAQRILGISDEISEIYEQLDHFNKHGVLPPVKQELVKKKPNEMDTAELMQRQVTLRTYVTKYTRRVKESKTAKTTAENQLKLDQYTVELEDVSRRLRK